VSKAGISGHVLDASALLAMLQDEKGADLVRSCLRGSWISAVNLAEVLTKGIDGSVPLGLQQQGLAALPLKVVPFDAELAADAAALRPATRAAGLSLGDLACLALGRRLGLPVLTGERDWARLDAGVKVKLIR
jgi:ribonuclease VapC